MIPLNLMLIQAKAYAKAILAGILLVVILGTGIWIKVLQHQRNKAREQVATLQKTVDGYVVASTALQGRLDTASASLAAEDSDNKALLADLQKNLPKNPTEATAWAIEASKRIALEAR